MATITTRMSTLALAVTLVAGCDQRRTMIVICQEGTDTRFAAAPDAGWRGQ